MGWTEVGVASNPAHEGTNTTTPTVVTPPGSMAAGDLVYLCGATKTNTSTLTISEAGGQAWNELAQQSAGANRALRGFWCVFDGTWDADPSIAFSAVTTFASAVMLVLRPDTGETASLSVEGSSQNGAAPATPFDVTLTGVTTVQADEVVIAMQMTADDNELTVQTAGWTQAGGAGRFDNLSGNDGALAVVYKVFASASSLEDVTIRQTLNGGDQWIGSVQSFKAEVLAAAGPPLPRRERHLGAFLAMEPAA